MHDVISKKAKWMDTIVSRDDNGKGRLSLHNVPCHYKTNYQKKQKVVMHLHNMAHSYFIYVIYLRTLITNTISITRNVRVA